MLPFISAVFITVYIILLFVLTVFTNVFGGITPFSVGLIYNSLFFLHTIMHTVSFADLLHCWIFGFTHFDFFLLLFSTSPPISFWHP